ncbi:sterol desaturase family protein [Alcanivorax sp. 1008]|uniref:sterol desaturase family protein n=1 Tax=Alcanivorax sp. 1008 TaxID=2816853 RepID=UPI001D483EB3|nr:sterol desaturase family protein [Alcanivorax sp. 1008]MCC1495871.1 sterol desaturase family protein [Alcanivorax sp. 1008]
MDPIEFAIAAYQAADPKQLILVAMLPLFSLTVVLEAWRFRHTDIYSLKDSAASMALGVGYVLLEVVVNALFVFTVLNWVYQYRLMTIEITPLTFIGLYLLIDLLFYGYHVVAHKVRWFWATHVVHHASEHMNFTTAGRQSILYAFSGLFMFFTPAILLGFDPVWTMFALALNLSYQWFIHTQWVYKLPRPIEFIFNTPSHHRVHHGRNPEYIDRNFAGTLIIWDRLFGTFVEEREDLPPEYGITRPIHSYNPVTLTLHEFIAMFRDVGRPGTLWLRLKHLWAGPEWQRPETDTQDAVASQAGQPQQRLTP